MDTPDEDQAVADVVDRLAAKHPDIEHDAKAQLRDMDSEAESEGASDPSGG